MAKKLVRKATSKAPAEKLVEVVLTLKRTYIVPICEKSGTSRINGWTLQEVIDDWFKTHSLNQYHATRDAYHLGNADELLKIEIKD